jgi:amidophosphoribosyltransferase
MKRVVGALTPKIVGFEASCFDGRYITGDVTEADFATLQAQRRLQFDTTEEAAEAGSRLALQGAEERR